MARLIVSAVATAFRNMGLIRVTVSVSDDATGQPVAGLAKDGFTVFPVAGSFTRLVPATIGEHTPGFYTVVCNHLPWPHLPQQNIPIPPGTIDLAVAVKKKKDVARLGEFPFHCGQVIVQVP